MLCIFSNFWLFKDFFMFKATLYLFGAFYKITGHFGVFSVFLKSKIWVLTCYVFKSKNRKLRFPTDWKQLVCLKRNLPSIKGFFIKQDFFALLNSDSYSMEVFYFIVFWRGKIFFLFRDCLLFKSKIIKNNVLKFILLMC